MFRWLTNQFGRRSKDPCTVAIKTTEKTNTMLEGIENALERHKAEWQLVEYGTYRNKPTLARILRYVVELSSDDEAVSLVLQGRTFLNDDQATNPHMRLRPGTHICYLEGVGSYRFETTVS